MLKQKPIANDTDAVREEVIRIVAEISSVPAAEISDEQNLYNDLAWDSLDGTEGVMEIEESFDISVPDEILERVQTVGEMIEGVRRLVEAG